MRVKDLEVGHCGNYSRNHTKYHRTTFNVLVFANISTARPHLHWVKCMLEHIPRQKAQPIPAHEQITYYAYTFPRSKGNKSSYSNSSSSSSINVWWKQCQPKERRKCDTTCSIIPICRTIYNTYRNAILHYAHCTAQECIAYGGNKKE